MTKTRPQTDRPNKANEAMATVVAQLVDAIEAGTVGTWSMPWQQIGADLFTATNAATGNRYSGGNRIALAIMAMVKGYTSGTWATYRQWESVGAQVRRGEKATQIVRPVEIKRHDTDTTDDDEQRPRIAWRAVSVFNVAQQDGWTAPDAPTDTRPPIEAAEALLTAWQAAGMTYREGGDRAFYSPVLDVVTIPTRAQFPVLEHYYSTAFHEATHWTAHRLGRTTGVQGTDEYAAEELVAELGAAMLGAHVGIAQASRDDHTAYLAGWLRNLKANPGHLWTAASHAERAAAHLLDLADPTTEGN